MTDNGALKTARYESDARKAANEKADAVSTTPATAPASDKISFEAPAEKEHDAYERFADNDGQFHLEKLNDETNVEAGKIMENQAREPAHQQHELAVEEDAPGYEQSAALMTPRGNEHYDEGGSIAEVNAGEEAGEA
jgi:hypothetical protein